MRNIAFIFLLAFSMNTSVLAMSNCVQETNETTLDGTVVVACKPGYYLENSTCKECPNIANNKGTSADKNAGGITDCYLTPGTYEDESGTFKIPENNNCYYTTGS